MKREADALMTHDYVRNEKILIVRAPVLSGFKVQALADETGKPINFMVEVDRFPNHAMKESYMRDILRKVTLCASL